MAKFTRLNGGERGRPRINKGDKTGTVRIVVSMPGVDGNISRTISIADAKVSDVFKFIETNTKLAPVVE